jgi:hypothetical protein
VKFQEEALFIDVGATPTFHVTGTAWAEDIERVAAAISAAAMVFLKPI